MVDVKDHLEEGLTKRPDLMENSDLRPSAADGRCVSCKELHGEELGAITQDKTPLFEYYNFISVEEQELKMEKTTSALHICLLCPDVVNVFVFKTRTWGK